MQTLLRIGKTVEIPVFTRRVMKKKEKRIDKIREKKAKGGVVVDDVEFDMFDEFVEQAKELKDDYYVPKGEDDCLLSVSAWVSMPDVIKKLMCVEGLPCGLIAMAYGLPDCGKTTFANEALASVQRDGGLAIFLKTEDKYSLKRAAAQGVNVKKLIIYRPQTIEKVGERIETIVNMIRTNPKWLTKKVCIVWDSLAATPCEAEVQANRREFSMDAAKAVRGVLRRIQGLIKEMNISFLIINQVYDNMNMFGEKTTPYGGKGAIYHSAILLQFAKKGRIRPPKKKSGDDFCGITCAIEVKKNHLGQPFKTGEVDIDWKGYVVDRDPEYAPEEFIKEIKEEEEEDEVHEELATGKDTGDEESDSKVYRRKKKGSDSKAESK